MANREIASKAFDYSVLIVLGASLFGNLAVLALYTQGRIAFVKGARTSNAAARMPAPGAQLRTINLVDLEGKPFSPVLGSDPRSIVLYVFSPACRWCEANRRAIESLANQEQQNYRFIGVSIVNNGLREYLHEKPLPFPVFVADSHVPRGPFRLSTTPETLVFSPEGSYLRGWSGAYIGPTGESVSNFFSAHLPN